MNTLPLPKQDNLKIANDLLTNRFEKGWGKAASLNQSEAEKTADFLVYSVLTTVANRPDKNFSWTNNWPPEPSIGNTATTQTFVWTSASLTILFFAIGSAQLFGISYAMGFLE